ncbi:dihydrofolate synthase/folylpolyglutamate synthase [Geothermobacter ehrlichii]|uniref:Dihydrofolate synthase/folylpolyglutamate synthase n=1 Tax=Geothermobacter ehrlichii TaxID=213224 RepID=A0A5D3WG70_9BACT|nr:folylpolyglutamate synthase/dihydrofolate synthase family protein [Geothermobacter ehrlichii]TYO95691.1 dihydrofolate synthase/folylpolyglutamate synthase [Geothermobacter ehrlichii]
MDYRRSLDYLYGLQRFGIKLGLDNVRRMLGRLGYPDEAFPIVHLAGTNGKGSTAAALAAVTTAAGVRTGLYTSPHLHSFTERIRIDGRPIGEAEVAGLTDELRRKFAGIPATFFEFTTVLALEYFRRRRIELAILETGMGGRLDATNAVCPRLCLITPIGLDHQEHLGSGLTAIAAEKAGIIKPCVPVLTAVQPPEAEEVLKRRAGELGSPLLTADRDWRMLPEPEGRCRYSGRLWELAGLSLPLAGVHQRQNIGLALAAAECLAADFGIEPVHVRQGLAQLAWPGRLEWFDTRPPVLLDGAHNPAGIDALADYLAGLGRPGWSWVAAFKADKAWQYAVERLSPHLAGVYCAPLSDLDCVAPQRMRQLAQKFGLEAVCCASAGDALRQAVKAAGAGVGVLVAGSLYLVGELRPQVVGMAVPTAGTRQVSTG